MDILLKILILLVLLLMASRIFAVLYFPFLALYALAVRRNKSDIISFFLTFGKKSVEKIHFKGGAERLVIKQIGEIPSCTLRKVLYNLIGVRTSKDVVFHYGAELRAPYHLSVGKGSIIGDNCILDARRGLTIGRNVNLSSNVSIYTLQHDYRDPDFGLQAGRKMSVEIDDRVWLGPNVIVLPGVHIGEGAVCCAGAVVTKDVDPFSVVAGIPAKVVSTRPKDLQYNFKASDSPRIL